MASVNEGAPASFFEWDGTNLSATVNPPNAANDGSFYGHLLALPTGQILLADYSKDVELFNPTGSNDPAWAPQITHVPTSVTHGLTYTVKGLRFAGMSQGAAYGDDYQPYTNYALVRITNNSTGHVFYCRTKNPSSYALQSSAVQTTHFTVPASIELGPSTLEVVTNGISSGGVSVTVN